MDSEFDRCLVLNTRMAARAVTRRYDKRLRPHGVSAAQFSILNAIGSAPDRSVTELAHSIAMERSTLSRNIDLLVRKGLVARQEAAKGNGRLCSLSPTGQELVDSLVPEWRAAQGEMAVLLGGEMMDSTIGLLKKLSSL